MGGSTTGLDLLGVVRICTGTVRNLAPILLLRLVSDSEDSLSEDERSIAATFRFSEILVLSSLLVTASASSTSISESAGLFESEGGGRRHKPLRSVVPLAKRRRPRVLVAVWRGGAPHRIGSMFRSRSIVFQGQEREHRT